MWSTTTEHISIHGGLHEDHPCLNCKVLSAAIYEYYIHVYQNIRPPYHKCIVKLTYKVSLKQEALNTGCHHLHTLPLALSPGFTIQ